MIRIQASVGRGGLNRAEDVHVVQKALNEYRRRYGRGRNIPESSLVSFDMVNAIRDFQREFGVEPSGVILPTSPTLHASGRAGGLANIGESRYLGAGTTVEVLVSDGRLLSQGSQWGHVAIDVAGVVYSRAHTGYDSKPRSNYLYSNRFRATVGLVLRVSPADVSTMRAELRRRVALNESYDLLGNSCSTNVADVLEMVGVLAHDPRFQWDASRRTAVSPKEVLLIVSRSSRVVRRTWYPKTK